ncbi:DUF1684 domain-containing protein [Cytophagaceae bacterium YF14B1]|uniref:DUF1684 domain-containing protein n=1 Tax=Xanthocytophaga flava TaxID=3048013 RepID=A0AAE3R199_9BACT|nr:DUF1684 domain-containing protein [Xanthocytophaga flavus]MDJ1486263.1 DUF1684 domain-containing protein [Xanthocytophaga flavus]
MNVSKSYLPFVLLSLILVSFKGEAPYEAEIKEWHQKRIESLKKEDGWLNLAGLYWLEEGENTFGGDASNAIVFPKDRSNAFLGKFILKEGKVTLIANKDAQIFEGEQPVSEQQIFPSESPKVLKHKSLRWFVIQRGNKYAVRLRDLESPALKNFKGINTYPVDQKWKLKARFVPTVGKKISIVDITGRTYEQESPGQLVFTVQGKEYTLDAVGTKERLHFIFADKTNGDETYGGGRFLDAPGPDADGYTWLDFNKAYNPPCAFSPYATCPTPPKQNRLTASILAGEKTYGDHQ